MRTTMIGLIALLMACEAPQPEAEQPAPVASTPAGTDGGYEVFVAGPNREASGRAIADDPVLRETIDASILQHVQSWSFFARLEAVHEDYATALGLIREAGLPDVVAAIPYVESRYRADVQSDFCARGPWQLMPEVAHSAGVRVEDCQIDGMDAPWTPTASSPPGRILTASAYARPEGCLITSCAVDERTDLARSTEAATQLLSLAWNDEVLRASGAVVQLTVASHNAGWDDGQRGGQSKAFNVRPAFERWAAERDPALHPTFAGASLTTVTPGERSFAGSTLAPETQHYAYTVIATHLLAACYYGQNHADDPVFAAYADDAESWCRAWAIPSRSAVLEHSGASR